MPSTPPIETGVEDITDHRLTFEAARHPQGAVGRFRYLSQVFQPRLDIKSHLSQLIFALRLASLFRGDAGIGTQHVYPIAGARQVDRPRFVAGDDQFCCLFQIDGYLQVVRHGVARTARQNSLGHTAAQQAIGNFHLRPSPP